MADDPGVYDAGDPNAIESQRRQAEIRERDDDETIRIWMGHPKGRDFLYRFVFDVAKAREHIETDIHGSTDVPRTFVGIGERNMGNWWHDRMQRHPDLYMKMLQEQEAERQARADRLKKQNEQQEDPYGWRDPTERNQDNG